MDRRERVPGVHVYDGRSWESEIARAFGVSEIPFNVVVGHEGKVVAINQHGKQMEKVVKDALGRLRKESSRKNAG